MTELLVRLDYTFQLLVNSILQIDTQGWGELIGRKALN